MKLHIKQKANHYTDHSYSVSVRWVFLKGLTYPVDSHIAPKTQTIINVDILIKTIFLKLCLHVTFKSDFLYALFLIEVCVLLTTKPWSTNTLNAIGHCIVWFLFDILISLRLNFQSLSLLWSSCEKL